MRYLSQKENKILSMKGCTGLVLVFGFLYVKRSVIPLIQRGMSGLKQVAEAFTEASLSRVYLGMGVDLAKVNKSIGFTLSGGPHRILNTAIIKRGLDGKK